MKRTFRIGLSLVLLGCGLANAQDQDASVVLDGRAKGQVFYGIGAVSAGASSRLLVDYPEPQRSQILNYLFKPDYGAALQHLKVEIGADANSTDGSEPSYARSPTDRNFHRGYEWWLMQEARKRNPHIVLDSLAWGAPGWVRTFYSPKTAEYMAGFLQGAHTTYGLDIAYTGVRNETPFDGGYVKALRKALDREQVATEIVCCDETTSEGQWKILSAMKEDPALDASVAVVTMHYPRIHGEVTTPPAARLIRQPIWSSEDQPASSASQIHSRDWETGGRELAQLYNDNYLKGGFTATEIWSPVTSYYDILAAPNSGLMYANTPWSGSYRVQGAIWATAHTTQFAQPGWLYLRSSCGYLPEKGDYVTLMSPKTKDWSVILQTIGAKNPQTVHFQIQGGLMADPVHIWETNSVRTFEHIADVVPRDGSFAYTFAPDSLYSLTTTTGQHRGDAAPPPAANFPFPWRADFNRVPLRGTAPYLSDQDGAFEVLPCLQGRGDCLEQVITEKPIPWGGRPDPWTLAGDEEWTDYRLSSKVRFLGQGEIRLLGRIDSANVFADKKAKYPSGYVFKLDATGHWALLRTAYKASVVSLAQGVLAMDTRRWHALVLAFQGNQISASLDGRRLASVTDSAHTHGMVGIGTGWNRAQFDNLSVR
ncbi:MAG: galactosylceramidase [Acidobacteriota bacterium]